MKLGFGAEEISILSENILTGIVSTPKSRWGLVVLEVRYRRLDIIQHVNPAEVYLVPPLAFLWCKIPWHVPATNHTICSA